MESHSTLNKKNKIYIGILYFSTSTSAACGIFVRGARCEINVTTGKSGVNSGVRFGQILGKEKILIVDFLQEKRDILKLANIEMIDF